MGLHAQTTQAGLDSWKLLHSKCYCGTWCYHWRRQGGLRSVIGSKPLNNVQIQPVVNKCFRATHISAWINFLMDAANHEMTELGSIYTFQREKINKKRDVWSSIPCGHQQKWVILTCHDLWKEMFLSSPRKWAFALQGSPLVKKKVNTKEPGFTENTWQWISGPQVSAYRPAN